MTIRQYLDTLDNTVLFDLYFHAKYIKLNEEVWHDNLRTINNKIKAGEIEKPANGVVSAVQDIVAEVLIVRYYKSVTQGTTEMNLF